MRTLVVATLVALVSLPVAARPHRRHHARAHAHARPAPAVHVVPNDRQVQEHARAEAELSDLRAGRIGGDDDQAQPAAAPAQSWAVQENDAEVPSSLRANK